jgi:hypothetical protein
MVMNTFNCNVVDLGSTNEWDSCTSCTNDMDQSVVGNWKTYKIIIEFADYMSTIYVVTAIECCSAHAISKAKAGIPWKQPQL